MGWKGTIRNGSAFLLPSNQIQHAIPTLSLFSSLLNKTGGPVQCPGAPFREIVSGLCLGWLRVKQKDWVSNFYGTRFSVGFVYKIML